jgi:hypothetical protein
MIRVIEEANTLESWQARLDYLAFNMTAGMVHSRVRPLFWIDPFWLDKLETYIYYYAWRKWPFDN